MLQRLMVQKEGAKVVREMVCIIEVVPLVVEWTCHKQ